MKKQAINIISLTVWIMSLGLTGFAQLPDPGFTIDDRTAIVITDPQNDFLSPQGVAWGVVGKSVEENNTVENLETLFQLAEQNNIQVFISPHYYYKHDHLWRFEGALEKTHARHIYVRSRKSIVTRRF